MSHAVLSVSTSGPEVTHVRTKTPIFIELWMRHRPPGIALYDTDYEPVPDPEDAA